MNATVDALAGRLRVQPGSAQPLSGSRPVITPALMHRLTQGLPASDLPARLGQVFSLCGPAHQMTARRAVLAAAGEVDSDAQRDTASRLLHLWTAREHLQRLALDLPLRLPVPGLAADGHWLRGLPLQALPESAAATDSAALSALAAPLTGWLETQVLGGAADAWLAAWQAESAQGGIADHRAAGHGPLLAWARTHDTPVQRWLAAVQPAALALQWPCRPLGLVAGDDASWQTLARQLADDPGFTQRPHWQGGPAETGCWTRAQRPAGSPPPQNAWMRLSSRVAELVALAAGQSVLRSGALSPRPGEGLAWTEMSRGLLVHWVRLAPGGGAPVVQDCRVLAPTEWNFHPQGGLAQALTPPGLAPDAVRAAVAAMDACVPVDLVLADSQVAGHA